MNDGQRGRAMAWLMFLPAALLLYFAVRQRLVSPNLATPFESPAEPTQLGEADPLPGWEGNVDLGDGASLELRFEPLHPDPLRQRFDAGALCRALRPGEYSTAFANGGPAPAEPWRLTITGGGPDADLDRVLVSGLDGVRVEGFEPVVPAGTEAQDLELGPSDPVAALLRFPTDVLTVNQRCDLVFWGPAPSANGASIGLVAHVPGVTEPVPLGPRERQGSRSTRSMAVMDGVPVSPNPGASREVQAEAPVDTGEVEPPPR